MRWLRTLWNVIIALVLVGLVFPRLSPRARGQLTGWWSRKLLSNLNIVPAIHGAPPDLQQGNLFIVSNHVSWLDVFLISAVHPSRFVAKSEIRDWPVIGWLCDKAGTLFIRRTRRGDTNKMSQRIHQVLAEGWAVGLFPEGTTTDGQRLHKFHTALFESAVSNQACVVPAAIRYLHGNGEYCGEAAYIDELSFPESLALIIRQKMIIAYITFAPTIETAGQTRREIAEKAEHAIAAILDVDVPRHRKNFIVADGQSV